jgi:hypothetical protein
MDILKASQSFLYAKAINIFKVHTIYIKKFFEVLLPSYSAYDEKNCVNFVNFFMFFVLDALKEGVIKYHN